MDCKPLLNTELPQMVVEVHIKKAPPLGCIKWTEEGMTAIDVTCMIDYGSNAVTKPFFVYQEGGVVFLRSDIALFGLDTFW